MERTEILDLMGKIEAWPDMKAALNEVIANGIKCQARA